MDNFHKNHDIQISKKAVILNIDLNFVYLSIILNNHHRK